MDAKDKANDLIKSMLNNISGVPKRHILFINKMDSHTNSAMACARICVEEMLGCAGYISPNTRDEYRKYWNDVKDELNNL